LAECCRKQSPSVRRDQMGIPDKEGIEFGEG